LCWPSVFIHREHQDVKDGEDEDVARNIPQTASVVFNPATGTNPLYKHASARKGTTVAPPEDRAKSTDM